MAIQPIRIVIQGIDQFSSTIAQSQKKIEKFGKGLSQVGKKMTIGLTLPIVAFGASTLKTAADFEMSMNRVQVLSRATGEQLEAMEKQARDLGATTKFSASEAGDAMGYLAMAGFSAEKIMGAMPGTLALAAASGMDLARTADIASNILTGFNLQATEMNRVADVMAYTMSAANVDVEMLGQSMKFVAPIAAGMNVPIEEVSAAIGFLGNAGIQGAMGGTALRQMFASLAKPTNETAKALARLKIPKSELIDATGNVKGIIPVIAALERQGATAADVLEIFGTKVGPAMQALLKQGSGPLRKFTEELEKSGGTAQKIADAQMKGLAGQLKNLKSAFEELQLAIADSGILEWVTGLVIGLVNLTRKVGQLSPAFFKVGVIIAGVVAAIGPLLMILGPIITGIATLSGWIASAGGVVALLSNPIGWVIAAIMALIAAVIAMKAKFGMSIKSIGAGLLALSGPIGWVIAIFIKNWSKVLPFLKLIGLGFKALGTLILYILWPVFKVLELFGDLLGWVTGKILDLLSSLARLVLPKWLEEKIGLTSAETSQNFEAQNLAGRAGAINRNENETKITIEDRAGVKLRTETKQGTIDTEVMRGLGFQGAM